MAGTALRAIGTPRRIERQDTLPLGMMMLSPFGLSEQWLLRDGGDRHWGLIAEALGQSGIAFHDAEGHPVYAAFCATELALEPSPGGLLGTEVQITSSLHELAPNRIGSEHHFRGAHGPLGTLRMISCFLRHDGSGSNRKLLRSSLPGLADLPPPTQALEEVHRRARGRARYARDRCPPTAPILDYAPLPALDFNAVGLLYFPTFSKLAEMAQPSQTALARREIVYLGNLDPGETITAHEDAGGLRLSAGTRAIALVSNAHHRPR
ncbi:Pnap_2097 family protein [Alloyangia pacifica]|uniref:Pnap_2097 family protein n=1 Tax=Alloyangia pacifica TaxID=311180 RepID=UPI001CD3F2E9|nr:Pnap_2097 family protein [Alloyangia pacifica]MCA0996967.1 hypothetical protein [Alloyangia pacifica]